MAERKIIQISTTCNLSRELDSFNSITALHDDSSVYFMEHYNADKSHYFSKWVKLPPIPEDK